MRVTFISDNGIEDIITGNKFTEKFTINETQKKILDLILADAKITRAAIAEQIGMTTRGVQKSIDGLRQAGLVERIGSAKSGHWVVNQIDDINKEE